MKHGCEIDIKWAGCIIISLGEIIVVLNMDKNTKTDEVLELLQKSLRLIAEELGSCSKGGKGILYYLYKVHDGASSGELREHFQIGSGGIANALKELEMNGYIERKSSIDDKRVVLVYISESGKKVAEELIMEIEFKVNHLLEVLGEDDTKAFMRILSQIIALNKEENDDRNKEKCIC